jgi:hypothetical protein
MCTGIWLKRLTAAYPILSWEFFCIYLMRFNFSFYKFCLILLYFNERLSILILIFFYLFFQFCGFWTYSIKLPQFNGSFVSDTSGTKKPPQIIYGKLLSGSFQNSRKTIRGGCKPPLNGLKTPAKWFFFCSETSVIFIHV